MKSRKGTRWCCLILSPGLLLLGGCLSAVEQGVDLLFSPGAVENALVLPYRAVSALLGV